MWGGDGGGSVWDKKDVRMNCRNPDFIGTALRCEAVDGVWGGDGLSVLYFGLPIFQAVQRAGGGVFTDTASSWRGR